MIVEYNNEKHEKPLVELFISVRDQLRWAWPPDLKGNKDPDANQKWIIDDGKDLRNYCVVRALPVKEGVARLFGGRAFLEEVVGFVALEELKHKRHEDTGLWTTAFDRVKNDHPIETIVLVRRIFVRKDMRRKHIGTLLLRHAIRTIQEVDQKRAGAEWRCHV